MLPLLRELLFSFSVPSVLNPRFNVSLITRIQLFATSYRNFPPYQTRHPCETQKMDAPAHCA
jgi:hypothetical protein